MNTLVLALFIAFFLVSASRDVCDFGNPRHRNCLEYIRSKYARFGLGEFQRIGLTTNVCFAFTSQDLQKLSNRVDSIASNISLAELLSFGCLFHIASASGANFDMLLEPVMADQGRTIKFVNKNAASFCKHRLNFKGTCLQDILDMNCNNDPV